MSGRTRRRLVGGLLAAAAAPLLPACAGRPPTAARRPLVIAHRGASGYLPEHTLAAYELAVRMGADFIEPDLQRTADGVLVAMHDDTLGRTTDADAVLGPRDGGWRVADCRWAELQRLTVRPPAGGTARALREGFEPRNPALRIPAFDEVIALARTLGEARGRPVGLYPEAKAAGRETADAIADTLAAHGLAQAGAPVFVQSFHEASLRHLATRQGRGVALRLVQLGDPAVDADGRALGVRVPGRDAPLPFAEVAGYASGVGLRWQRQGRPLLTRAVIAAAHDAGLVVHGWTFAQPDPARAAPEFAQVFADGLDGVFANYPDLAVDAVRRLGAG